MASEPFVAAARVVKTHGLKGEVSVAPATDLPFVFREGLHVWFVPPPSSVREGVIESVRSGPKGPLLKIEGIDDIDTATTLRGCTVLVHPSEFDAEDLAAATDFTGYETRTDDGDVLGTITETIVTGANDVWVVEGERYGQVLLPVIDDVVREIDDDACVITVRLLPGLIEGDT